MQKNSHQIEKNHPLQQSSFSVVLNQQFELFSEARKAKFPDFEFLPFSQKKEIIKQLHHQLNREYLDKLLGPKIRHCSSETKQYCWEWFIGEKNPQLKEEAIREYDFRIAFEESLTYVFESYPQDLRQKFPLFFECRFDQKEEILNQLAEMDRVQKKNTSEQESLLNTLSDRLNLELLGKQISYTTYQEILVKAKAIAPEKISVSLPFLLQEIADAKVQYAQEKQRQTRHLVEKAALAAEAEDQSLNSLDRLIACQNELVILMQKISSLPTAISKSKITTSETPDTQSNQKSAPSITSVPAKITVNVDNLHSLQQLSSELQHTSEQVIVEDQSQRQLQATAFAKLAQSATIRRQQALKKATVARTLHTGISSATIEKILAEKPFKKAA